MDVGCYCINFSRLFAGAEPVKVQAVGHVRPGGVDDVVAGTIQFANGVLASFTCGMDVHVDNSAYVCGTEGYIVVPVPWKPPSKRAEFVIARSTPPRMDLGKGNLPPPRESRFVDAPYELYGLEAGDFAATVLDGKAPAVSEADTLGNMAVLDAMREQIGVRWDGD